LLVRCFYNGFEKFYWLRKFNEIAKIVSLGVMTLSMTTFIRMTLSKIIVNDTVIDAIPFLARSGLYY
jgi:hypothetical protein